MRNVSDPDPSQAPTAGDAAPSIFDKLSDVLCCGNSRKELEKAHNQGDMPSAPNGEHQKGQVRHVAEAASARTMPTSLPPEIATKDANVDLYVKRECSIRSHASIESLL